MTLLRNRSHRCDFCGKLSRAEDGYYRKPDGTAGYIHSPDWDKDGPFDTCEECAEKRCPACGSAQIVNITPATPGPTGWGGRCKDCGHKWCMPA